MGYMSLDGISSKRRVKIADYVKTHKRTEVADIAKKFKVKPMQVTTIKAHVSMGNI